MEKTVNRTKRISLERFRWEIARAFYSFWKSPLLAVLLLQVAALVIVYAKGAGDIYRDMVMILLAITLLSWFFTSVIHGNKKILIYAQILLTVGTMLQCILKQEEVLKYSDYYASHNPVTGLQIQYIIGFAAALLGAIVYLCFRKISSIKCCRAFVIISCGLSVFTILVASSVGNVKNWIHIGGFSLQTTELIKVFYIFIAAGLLGNREEPSKNNIRVFYIVSILQVAFLAVQSEFGTMLLLMMVFFTIVFLFIPDLKIFLKTILAFGGLSFFAIVTGIQLTKLQKIGTFLGTNPLSRIYLSNYNKIANRFIYWMHPEKDSLGLGYQLLKARESIYLGGWFGTSSVTDLPVKTSDLVYPALIQRCGLIFALLVFLIFIFMWLEGVRLFVRKQDRYHRIIGAGFVYLIFDQALIIIGGSTGLCPLTGITLPFISSGGSSLVVSFMILGIMIAVSGNVKWKGTGTYEETEFYTKSTDTTECGTPARHRHDAGTRKTIRDFTGPFRRTRSKKAGDRGKKL